MYFYCYSYLYLHNLIHILYTYISLGTSIYIYIYIYNAHTHIVSIHNCHEQVCVGSCACTRLGIHSELYMSVQDVWLLVSAPLQGLTASASCSGRRCQSPPSCAKPTHSRGGRVLEALPRALRRIAVPVRMRTTLLCSFPAAPLRERHYRNRIARAANSPAQSSQVESSAASVSSFGFGGTNGCVVLRLAEKAGSKSSCWEARVG